MYLIAEFKSSETEVYFQKFKKIYIYHAILPDVRAIMGTNQNKRSSEL